jgi:hypothetical protein
MVSEVSARDRWRDMTKLMGTFLQLIVMGAPKRPRKVMLIIILFF